MQISLKWLRQLVDFDWEPEAIGEALTLAGFEVEGIDDRRALADGVVAGKILATDKHPNADRLQVCQVDVGGDAPLNIVCGAPNARVGLYVPVATVSTYLPAIDLKLKQTKLRGVKSEGMICSLKELGLEEDSAGIHEFDGEPALGSDVRPLLGLDDAILDLFSTANRADALSMVGIAREVAALTRNPVRLPTSAPPKPARSPSIQLAVADSHHCPAYSASLIRGVAIGPSPEWLARKIEAGGQRSINNVVDITNYVLLEWGQPLHAFDWDRLQAVMGAADRPPTVGVRLAKAGERLQTLDGSDRPLAADNLVITAGDKPVALAGVMGGERMEVNDDSVNILLEAALFDPAAIRRSARSQSLRTEASARYERGVDASAWLTARDRAVALILEIAGGELVEQVECDARPTEERSIRLRLQRLIDVMGDEIAATDVEDILTALGFELALETATEGLRPSWKVAVPAYRQRDIEREIDLIEEFARLYGYDRFSATLPAEPIIGTLAEWDMLVRCVREAFRSEGLTELMQISLCPRTTGLPVAIANPIAEEFSALRQELLPGLIDALVYNLDRGNGPLNGFELGKVFWREGENYAETTHIGGIVGGNPTRFDWQGNSRALDWFGAKGLLLNVLDRLGLTATFQPEAEIPILHPGRTASLWLEQARLGSFGQLHPRVRSQRGLPDEVYAFELDLEVLLAGLRELGVATYRNFSTYPASDRDIAFFSSTGVSVGELEGAIVEAAGTLLESVQLFDEYRGKGVPDGQRSLAFRLLYRAGDRTLTEAEVESAHQQVRERLERDFAVSLRS
ncbi:phenylalanine--tRNA ligase subunit beta [Synechococcus sp. PCC 7336]|uniref:phenylalanine--tRNA ligase subunit beta n=1 Tax=Synechococcus sp. PCC 7336 TaxID=195250 RepID=UPI0003477943|nr:phenylalanine--tRNA ligase subunit beta [Synechococcus sp. PCC 7336]